MRNPFRARLFMTPMVRLNGSLAGQHEDLARWCGSGGGCESSRIGIPTSPPGRVPSRTSNTVLPCTWSTIRRPLNCHGQSQCCIICVPSSKNCFGRVLGKSLQVAYPKKLPVTLAVVKKKTGTVRRADTVKVRMPEGGKENNNGLKLGADRPRSRSVGNHRCVLGSMTQGLSDLDCTKGKNGMKEINYPL